MGQNVVPNETCGRVGHRVAARVRIASRKAGKRLFQVVRYISLVRPLMPVRTEYSTAVKVIQQHEFFDELVMIRRHLATEDAQAWIAFAFLDIAKHLVVGAIFFDDVQHMLEHRRLAVPLRHRPRLDVGRGGASALIDSVSRLFSRTVFVYAGNSSVAGSLSSVSVPW